MVFPYSVIKAVIHTGARQNISLPAFQLRLFKKMTPKKTTPTEMINLKLATQPKKEKRIKNKINVNPERIRARIFVMYTN